MDYVYQMMNRQGDMIESEENVLHIIVAKLLVRMCIYIDGVLMEAFNLCMGMLNGGGTTVGDRQRALIILGVISTRVSDRGDLVQRLF